MARVYTIVREHGAAVPTIFVPIKATLNPYNGASAFCADLPNFFGGKVENADGQDIANPTIPQKINTLNTELIQESQTRLQFQPSLVNPLPPAIYQTPIGTPNAPGTPYNFYVLDVNIIAAGAGTVVASNNFTETGHNNVNILFLNQLPAGNTLHNIASYYEYQCILQIPNTAFARNGGSYTNNSYGLIQLCNDATNDTIAGLHASVSYDLPHQAPVNFVEFEISETKIAFDVFLHNF